MPTSTSPPVRSHDTSAEDTTAMAPEPPAEPTDQQPDPGQEAPEQEASRPEAPERENRARNPWLVAALVGAAAPGVVPAPAAAAVPAVAPAAAAPAAVPAAAQAAVQAAGGGGYTVRPGDTLGHIAARTGTTVEALREANGLDARGFIREGQNLTLPGGSADEPAPAPAAATHTVRAGETLSGIASRTGTTVKALREANGLDARGFIREGQTLTLPGAAPRRAGAKPTPVPPVRTGSVEAAADANRAHLARQQVPGRAAMRDIVRREALRQGLDPALALAIAHQESGFNMRAVSYANAIGAMQVIPSSGEWASQMVGRHLDLFDAEDNATAGVAILRHLTRTNAEDIAIASYYQGNASVRSRGMYDDTRRYVANVLTLKARFS
ncbi:hypothetical protein NUM3379_18930 [Kineococcus sp. NUM-3379]